MIANRAPSTVRSRTERARRRCVGVLTALLALVAQATLPHLHLWQPADHEPRPATVSVAIQNVDGVARIASTADEHGDHAAAHCPICQVFAQSRDFLPLAIVLPAPVAAVVAPDVPSVSRTAVERAVAHAPRSPPTFA